MKAFFIAIGLALGVLACDAANSEDSNRNDVRAKLEDGWSVIYGKNFTEADWAQGVAAIAESIASDSPSSFLRWFGDEMNDNLTKIQRNLSDVAMSDLQRWIVQSLKQKTVIQYKGLRLEAGFATYNRWQRLVYDEPRTGQQKVSGPFGTWTYVPYVYTARVEKKIPLPNWNQFYLRYRLVPVNNGGSGSASNGSLSGAPSPMRFDYVNSHGQHGAFVAGTDGTWYETCDGHQLGRFRLKQRVNGNVTLDGISRNIAVLLPVHGSTGYYWMNDKWVPSADWRIVSWK
jgi:hypothetical protein